ncbi:MAG: ADP-ribosylglycohydrolase family protein [Planctomycetota bacterium]|nr:ADP-ribosylglycohydrolase family protein [Planctomycetota bacterium]
MSTNRDTLGRILRFGEIALECSPFLDQAPDPLPATFSFDKIDGMMLGLAIGDALGVTTESWLPSRRQATYGEIRDYIPNKYIDEPIGFPSDDSQLAFWTLEQMLADGGFRPDNVADCFCTRHIFGVGSAVREFLRNRKAGRPWQQCGAKSAGNGALMRIAPILIPHLKAPTSALWADAALAAMITHNDAGSTAACVAFVAMLWQLLAMDEAPADPYWWPRTFVSIANDLEGDTKYSPRGGEYMDYEGPIWRFVSEKLLNTHWREWPSVLDLCNSWYSGAYLLETVPSALYILMRHAHDPEEAIIRAVNDTKDNDTIAAIVGAAVGALHGKKKLPKRWIDKLSGRTTDSDDGRIFELLASGRRKWCPRRTTRPEPEARRYQSALDAAVDAAQEAGKLIRDDFHRPGGPRGSGSHAEVDKEAEQVIREKILAAFPAAYRGEETGTASGGDGEHTWLVDPNDGTSAYLKGWRGSAVSIALVRQGVLVLGVVYAPTYPDDNGDLFAWAEGCGPVTRNGKPLTTNLADKDLNGSDDVPAIIYISQDADKNPAGNAACVTPARFIAMPSIAYRLALVAAGEGVAAISLHGPKDWDYAGGHALLIGVGGTLIDQAGKPITYGAHGESHCRWCFGGAPAAADALYQRDWHSVFSSGAKSAGAFALVRPERGAAVPDPRPLSRAQGCLLGQLAGDSLGGLVEFRSAASIKSKYPAGLRELMDGGHWGILAGQPTDDSEMALMLARSIVQAKGHQPTTALDAYVHWYNSPPFDIGGTTSSALRGAKHGQTPQDRLAGAKQHANTTSQANGSLMRISPLAIFGAGNPAAAAEWARADSGLTHPHQVCQDACAVFVTAIATAIANGTSSQDCYQAALDEARRSSAAAPVVEALHEAAERPPQDYQTHQGWVLIALQNAFYQLLHAPSLEDGVVQTVMAGGDTDTNAAIAGALLGAVHGRDAIPPQWVRSILSCRPLPKSGTSHPRPIEFWPVDALRLAEKLLVLGLQAHDAKGVNSGP